MKIARINFDGACNNHLEKPAMGVGVAVFLEEVYAEELCRAFHVPAESREDKLTSNVAEWQGCIEAMKVAIGLRQDGYVVFVFSDSQVITNQFNGDFYINKPEFREASRTAHHYAQKAGVSKIKWVPREENQEADDLSKLGLYGEDWRNRKRKKKIDLQNTDDCCSVK